MMIESIPVKSLLSSSPFYFINRVFGYRVDGVHGDILEHLISNKRSLVLVARGHGKSKILQGYITWLIVNNPNKRVILVSDSDGKAQNFLRTIKAVLEASPIIKQYYGDVCGDRWTDHAITIRGRTKIHTEPSLMSVGAGSGAATGLHSDYLFLDDLVSFHSSRSELQRERDKDWFKTTLMPVLMASGTTGVVGTRYHPRDFYDMLINDLHYKTLILPAIIDERALCEWLRPLNDRYDEDGNIITTGLKTIRNELGSVIWSLQFMNDATILNDDNIIKPDYIQYYESIEWEDNQLYVRKDGSLIKIKKIILGVDPAISKSDSADYSAYVVVGKGADGNLYVLDAINKHLSFNSQIKEIEGLALKWQINQTNIEKVAYQEALIQELKRRSGLKINAITPTRDKVARLSLVSGFFESGKVNFLKSQTGIVNQLLTFTGDNKDHDDLVDAIVYGIWGYRNTGSGMLVLKM